MYHQVSVMMTENITKYHLKNTAGVRYGKRTSDTAA